MRDVDHQGDAKALYGMNEEKLLIRRHMENWIGSRKNAGLKVLDKIKDMEYATEIFKAWDTDKKGYLTAKEVAEQLVGLGLATDIALAQRLLQTLKMDAIRRDSYAQQIEVLTLKDFLKVFTYDNFGQRACDTIRAEFR